MFFLFALEIFQISDYKNKHNASRFFTSESMEPAALRRCSPHGRTQLTPLQSYAILFIRARKKPGNLLTVSKFPGFPSHVFRFLLMVTSHRTSNEATINIKVTQKSQKSQKGCRGKLYHQGGFLRFLRFL